MNDKKTISLAKFATRYLGIGGENLKLLSHEDIKQLFPNIKRSSFSYINKHSSDVESGKVILVNDGVKTIPYYAPLIDIDYQTEALNSEKIKNKEKEYIDYANMKIYELKQLLNVRFNGYHTSRAARNELEKRGVELRKKYNRNEFKNWRKDYERD